MTSATEFNVEFFLHGEEWSACCGMRHPFDSGEFDRTYHPSISHLYSREEFLQVIDALNDASSEERRQVAEKDLKTMQTCLDCAACGFRVFAFPGFFCFPCGSSMYTPYTKHLTEMTARVLKSVATENEKLHARVGDKADWVLDVREELIFRAIADSDFPGQSCCGSAAGVVPMRLTVRSAANAGTDVPKPQQMGGGYGTDNANNNNGGGGDNNNKKSDETESLLPKKFCPHCGGTVTVSGSKFCGECGKPLLQQ